MTFNCIVDSDAALYISWNVSGMCQRQSCSTALCPGGLSKKHCTYMINATTGNNGTQVQCLAMSADDLTCAESSIVNRSTTVELLIQGKHF